MLVLSRSRHFRIEPDGTQRTWEIATSRVRRWNWPQCERFGLIAGFIRHLEPPFAGHGTAFRASLRPILLPVAADYHDFWIDSIASALGDYVYVDEILTLHRVHERNTAGYGHRKPIVPKMRSSSGIFGKEIARWRAFVERVEAIGSLPERAQRSVALARRAISVLQRRQRARSFGWLGVVFCLAMLLRGDYHRTALGVFSFGRDVTDILRGPLLPENSRQ